VASWIAVREDNTGLSVGARLRGREAGWEFAVLDYGFSFREGKRGLKEGK
jgi:hypothetical protein